MGPILGRARLRDLWDTYRSLHWDHLSPRTRALYTRAWTFCALLPERPDPKTLAHWRQTSLAHLAPSYRNIIVGVLRCVARIGSILIADRELLASILSLRPEKLSVLPPRDPGRDFYDLGIAVCRDDAERAFFALGCRAGFRRGELLGFMPDDYDADTHVLSCLRQRNGRARKNGRPHSVSLPPDLAAWVEWTIAHHDEITHPSAKQCKPYLFPWAFKKLDTFIARIREATGLPKGIAWHACRHFAGSRRAEVPGAGSLDVMELLGQTSESSAQRYIAAVRGATHALALSLTSAPKPLQRVEPNDVDPRRRASAAEGRSQAVTWTNGMVPEVQWRRR